MKEINELALKVIRYLESHKNARCVAVMLLVFACCKAAFQFGTHIGEVVYLIIH